MSSTATTTSKSGRTRKALVAGALGVALLAGGGGTFANWYENQNIASGTVTAGHLALNADTKTQTWQDQTGKTIDPATFKMVPGDTVTYTVTAKPELLGDNLKANLTVEQASISGSMASWAKVSTKLNDGTADVANPLTPATANGKTITATVTITLPWDTAGDNTATTQPGNGEDAEDTTLDLSSVKLSLVQVK